MVSIEENSSDFAKALQGLLPNALAGLRGVTSPDVARDYVERAPTGDTGLTEPAVLKYLHETEEHTAQEENRTAMLTLVANNGDDTPAKDVDAANLEEARAAAVANVEYQLEQAENNHDVEAITRLTTLLQSVKSATSLGSIAIAQGQTSQLSASGKVESAEQRTERLWNELAAADQKINKTLDELYAEGLIDEETYKRLKNERAAFDKLPVDDPRRIAGEQKYQTHLEEVRDGLETRHPNNPTVEDFNTGVNSRRRVIESLTSNGAVKQAEAELTEPTNNTPLQPITNSIFLAPATLTSVPSDANILREPEVSVANSDVATNNDRPPVENVIPQNPITLAYADVTAPTGAPIGLPAAPAGRSATVGTTL